MGVTDAGQIVLFDEGVHAGAAHTIAERCHPAHLIGLNVQRGRYQPTNVELSIWKKGQFKMASQWGIQAEDGSFIPESNMKARVEEAVVSAMPELKDASEGAIFDCLAMSETVSRALEDELGLNEGVLDDERTCAPLAYPSVVAETNARAYQAILEANYGDSVAAGKQMNSIRSETRNYANRLFNSSQTLFRKLNMPRVRRREVVSTLVARVNPELGDTPWVSAAVSTELDRLLASWQWQVNALAIILEREESLNHPGLIPYGHRQSARCRR